MSQIKKFDNAQFNVEEDYPFQHPIEGLEPHQMANQVATQMANELGTRKEQRFSALFNQSAHFMALLNLDGTVVEVNQALLDFAGVSADIVLGHPFWQTIWWAATSQVPLQAAIAQAAQDQPIQYEAELQGAGDRVLTVDFALKLVRDEADKEQWLLAEGQDITQRKQAEAEIQRLNAELAQQVTRHTAQLEAAKAKVQLYADIVQNMQMAIHVWYLVDPDDATSLELVTINPIAVQIAQRPLDLMLGKRILECFPAMPIDQVAQMAEVARSGDQKLDLEVAYSDEQISGGVYTCHVFPLPGRCVGAAIEDITDRKQAEEDLKDNERRYATLTNLASVGISRINAHGERIYVNDRWSEIAGLSPQDALVNNWQDMMHPDDATRILPEWEAAFRQRQPYLCECRFIHPNGETKWVIGQALPDISAEGKFLGYVSTITDITDRKRSEMHLQERADELSQVNHLLTRTSALLEERNRELDQFAYVTSHDLKAPLRAIANLSEWIEDDLAGTLPPENQRQMELLRGRVCRMESLIDGLLQYSRVGRTQVETETVSVQTLLTEVVDSIDPPDSFTLAIGEGMPTLPAKSLLLRQVFANLIGNAVKHHPRSDGQVSITVQDQGSCYEFAISDDGRGIASEHHEKIFDIFHTLEARDTKESTGIGLSIVKKIVETEGGSIRVDSQVGTGTTFRFTWMKHPKVH